MFLLERNTKLTDTAADGVLNETVCALVLRVAAERAGCVGAEKVWSTVVGPQSTLIYIYNRQGGKNDQSINILCRNLVFLHQI